MIHFAEDDNGFGCDRFEIWLVLWVGKSTLGSFPEWDRAIFGDAS
jgi:hypothetical protein